MRSLKHITLGLFLSFLSAISYADDSSDDLERFSKAELEQILAPIALYPDTVLSHILIASTYPLEVIQAERWTTNNTDLEGSDAVEAVEDKDWDPSVQALVAFPQVLKRLSENLEWTQNLGDAFLQDEERVLESVQSLRQKAYEAGSLDKMDKVSVTHEDNSIIIEPVRREVVYVPYYDTRVVYGSWRWSHYPPVYWHYPSYVHHYDHYTPFYWGPRIRVSFGFFFSSFHWHNHHIVRIPRHHYRPNRYYDRRQIVRHEHARRWAHNPVHRRGVSYRSVTVSNRYKSNRMSNTEIREHRKSKKYSIENRKIERKNERKLDRKLSDKKLDKRKADSKDTRIATPNRIREELKDGRISKEERKSRPVNKTQSNGTKQRIKDKKPPHKQERTLKKKEKNVKQMTPPKRNVQPQKQIERSRSKPQKESSNRSNSRSSDKQKSSRSDGNRKSSNRQSSSNKSHRARGNKDNRR